MGILSQQLIGGGNLKDAARAPFSDAIGPDDVANPGFGGYTYARDPEQQEVFGTTAVTDRTGPTGDVALGNGDTTYGPVGRRIGTSTTTILGQMADMLSMHGADATWSTAGGGAKMGHTFATGTATRSLRDTSGIVYGNTTIPAASGGAVPGYDANNQYDISSYFTEGTPAQEAVPAVAEQRHTYTGEVMVAAEEAVAAVAAVEAGYFETFTKAPTMSTGLRNMAPAPEEGSAGAGPDASPDEDTDAAGWPA